MPSYIRISDLPLASAITGNELVEVSQPSAVIRISGTGISAAASDNSFNDSGSGFVVAGFAPGDRVVVTGFSTGANNVLVGVIVSVAAGKIVIGGGPVLINEAAGPTVTIAKWTSRRTPLSALTTTVADGSITTAKIADNAVTGVKIAASTIANSKLANMAANTVKGRLLSSGAPQDLTGTQLTTLIDTFTATLKGLVPAPGGTPTGTAFLRDDGVWAVPSGGGGGGGYTHPNHTGDVTSVGDGATTIAANAVGNTKLADMPANTIKGNATGASADPADLTGTQVTAILDDFVGSGASHKKGLVPTPGATPGSGRFLCEDATWKNPIESLIIAASDEGTALTVGANKVTFRMPYAFTLTAIRASLTTAQASGSIFTVDVNENGVSILSTKLTIDNTEKTSVTAATAPVISDTSLADDAEITIDIDQVGNGSAAGLKVYLIGRRT